MIVLITSNTADKEFIILIVKLSWFYEINNLLNIDDTSNILAVDQIYQPI